MSAEATAVEVLRDRLFSDIEGALRCLHRHEDPRPAARELRRRFPAPTFFLESSAYAKERCGLSARDAFYFQMIPALARRSAVEAFGSHPRLNRLSATAAFVKSLYIGVHVECFYLILLGGNGTLIDAQLLQRGTVDNTPFYLKDVLSSAVEHRARAVVLSHNHPAGTLRPSDADVKCTLMALKALATVGVVVPDHVIVAKDRAVSLRDSGLIDEGIWTAQSPGSRMLREWVDADLLSDLE